MPFSKFHFVFRSWTRQKISDLYIPRNSLTLSPESLALLAILFPLLSFLLSVFLFIITSIFCFLSFSLSFYLFLSSTCSLFLCILSLSFYLFLSSFYCLSFFIFCLIHSTSFSLYIFYFIFIFSRFTLDKFSQSLYSSRYPTRAFSKATIEISSYSISPYFSLSLFLSLSLFRESNLFFLGDKISSWTQTFSWAFFSSLGILDEVQFSQYQHFLPRSIKKWPPRKSPYRQPTVITPSRFAHSLCDHFNCLTQEQLAEIHCLRSKFQASSFLTLLNWIQVLFIKTIYTVSSHIMNRLRTLKQIL